MTMTNGNGKKFKFINLFPVIFLPREQKFDFKKIDRLFYILQSKMSRRDSCPCPTPPMRGQVYGTPFD